jgi:ABC-type multidrug transport system ATPase subunit/pSer/pThr/pTyr-binding forkhead associated (FHA) protein/ABC-type multidrug transport system permease subunit
MSNSDKLRLGFVSDGKLLVKFAFVQGQPSEVVVGRSSSAQICINNNVVSSQHAQLIFDANGNLHVIDMNSSNGTFLNDRKLEPGVPYQVRSTDRLYFSGMAGVELVFNPDNYEMVKVQRSSSVKITGDNNFSTTNILEKFNGKRLLTVGRNADCDVFLGHESISRNHATIEKKGANEFVISDLGSLNGTYVNGRRVNGTMRVTQNDTIIIGRFQLSLSGKVKDLTQEVAIRTERIVKQFDNGKIGLHECSFEIPSKSLLAVMGPSGCGKSTLLKALNGDSPPSSGRVYISGLELNENYDYLKTQIGYVPQDDIVHSELTVEQSLYYAAKLRLEYSDSTFIQQKIEQVLKDLNIEHIRKNLVGKISGGQRKRVSIAVEILTDPLILFLDEPTSPLDPQTIEEFLEILRNLSNKGTTVIMVTHKPEDLNYMDTVIFMAEGGHKVYQGETSSYLSHFKVDDTIKVYAQLAMPHASKWIDNHKQNHPALGLMQAPKEKQNSRNANFFHQFWWLTIRYFNIKLNDRINTMVLVGQAPIIAGLICLIFKDITPAVPFLLAVSAVWFGTNNAAREIVGESPIYKRERMFNQGILAYMLSKITVLGTFAAIQSFLFTLIISLNFAGTDPTWDTPGSTFLWMLLVSLSASMMGLLLSAIVSTTEKVMTLVPIALIPQIMLAGIVAKISSPFVEILSYLTLSRWGNEGFCNVQQNVKIEVPVVQLSQNNDPSANSEQIVTTKWETHNSIDQLKDCFHDNYEKTFGNELAFSFRLDIIAITVLSILFLAGIYIALKRKDTIKIK